MIKLFFQNLIELIQNILHVDFSYFDSPFTIAR